MEILLVIIGIIFVSAKLGVGIKASLVKEIRNQCYGGIGAPSKSYSSISLEEAYKALRVYDANDRISNISNCNSYSFWALVNDEPCCITVKKEAFKRGIRLIVIRGEDYNQISRFRGAEEIDIPTNLRVI